MSGSSFNHENMRLVDLNLSPFTTKAFLHVERNICFFPYNILRLHIVKNKYKRENTKEKRKNPQFGGHVSYSNISLESFYQTSKINLYIMIKILTINPVQLDWLVVFP